MITERVRQRRGLEATVQDNTQLLEEIERIVAQQRNQRLDQSVYDDPQKELQAFLENLFVFDGNPANLQRFLYIGDCAKEACRSRMDETMLIRQMLVHLDGATYNKCALYKTYGTYEDLRYDLVKMCGTVRTVAQVQDEINSLKKGKETLIEYGSLATQLLSELMLATHIQYDRAYAEMSKAIYEDMVTRAYTRGLPGSLRILVASARHNELRNAISCAEEFQESGFVVIDNYNLGNNQNIQNYGNSFRFDSNRRNNEDFRSRTNVNSQFMRQINRFPVNNNNFYSVIVILLKEIILTIVNLLFLPLI